MVVMCGFSFIFGCPLRFPFGRLTQRRSSKAVMNTVSWICQRTEYLRQLSLQYSYCTLYGLSHVSPGLSTLTSDSTKAYFTQDFPEAETTMETYV